MMDFINLVKTQMIKEKINHKYKNITPIMNISIFCDRVI